MFVCFGRGPLGLYCFGTSIYQLMALEVQQQYDFFSVSNEPWA
jgi:hypothetical protein